MRMYYWQFEVRRDLTGKEKAGDVVLDAVG